MKGEQRREQSGSRIAMAMRIKWLMMIGIMEQATQMEIIGRRHIITIPHGTSRIMPQLTIRIHHQHM